MGATGHPWLQGKEGNIGISPVHRARQQAPCTCALIVNCVVCCARPVSSIRRTYAGVHCGALGCPWHQARPHGTYGVQHVHCRVPRGSCNKGSVPTRTTQRRFFEGHAAQLQQHAFGALMLWHRQSLGWLGNVVCGLWEEGLIGLSCVGCGDSGDGWARVFRVRGRHNVRSSPTERMC